MAVSRLGPGGYPLPSLSVDQTVELTAVTVSFTAVDGSASGSSVSVPCSPASFSFTSVDADRTPGDVTVYAATHSGGWYLAVDFTGTTATASASATVTCGYATFDFSAVSATASYVTTTLCQPASFAFTGVDATASPGSVTATCGTADFAFTANGAEAAGEPDTYTAFGTVYYFEEGEWVSAPTTYFEVFMKATSGAAYARLRNITDDTVVSGSKVTTTESALTRVRSSSAITLTDAKDYRAEAGTTGTMEIDGAQLIFNP